MRSGAGRSLRRTAHRRTGVPGRPPGWARRRRDGGVSRPGRLVGASAGETASPVLTVDVQPAQLGRDVHGYASTSR